MTDDSDYEALVAEIERHDANPDELALVRRDELNDLREDHESTQEERDEYKEKYEAEKTEKEDLREEVDAAKEARAEVLEDFVGLDAETLADRFSVDELGDMLDEHVDGGEKEALTPAPKSGDPDPEENNSPDRDPETEEEIEDLREKIDALEGRSGSLVEHQREHYEEKLAELTEEDN